ncbi:MAG: hypothetical protein JW884_01480 [Deltaproteobacteria bacterium]|nr:hypothetical protein [Deltaproteobacteria bacterium]
MKYDDDASYRFHEKDVNDHCFLCSANSQHFFIVRQISTMMMVHLCQDCMLDNTSEYLLDNTRPWLKGSNPKK